MDDGLLYGKLVAMMWSIDLIKSLEPELGLKMKYLKRSVYAPDAACFQQCGQILPSQLNF